MHFSLAFWLWQCIFFGAFFFKKTLRTLCIWEWRYNIFFFINPLIFKIFFFFSIIIIWSDLIRNYSDSDFWSIYYYLYQISKISVKCCECLWMFILLTFESLSMHHCSDIHMQMLHLLYYIWNSICARSFAFSSFLMSCIWRFDSSLSPSLNESLHCRHHVSSHWFEYLL